MPAIARWPAVGLVLWVAMSAAASQKPAEVKRRAAAMLANGASVRALARDLGIGRERATSLAREIEVEAEHARAAGHSRAMDALRETLAEANDAADELQELAAEATDLATRLAIDAVVRVGMDTADLPVMWAAPPPRPAIEVSAD